MRHPESSRPRVLVVDDEPNIGWLFRHSLGDAYEIVAVQTATQALAHLQGQGADLVMLDLCLVEGDGLQLLAEVQRLHPQLPVVMMTAHGTVRTAVQAIKSGAFDYLTKPFDLEELRQTMARALQGGGGAGAPGPALSAVVARSEPEAEAELPRFMNLVGQSPAMQELFRKLERVAPTDACVLLLGESGTGKELVARAIHGASPRAQKPFVAVNCAALPEHLLESELFGHEKGAFTGAQSRKAGRFELADGGTLLLDEIGDMPLSLQAKLLRVLETRVVEPLGSTRSLPVDVRILAATHRNLPEMVREGAFRQDLYFRLAVIPLRLPPLRERRGDIPLLANHMLRESARRYGKGFRAFSPAALRQLEAYRWPGNVRELRNLVEQIAVLWDGEEVLPEHLPDFVLAPPGEGADGAMEPEAPSPLGTGGNWAASDLKEQAEQIKAQFEAQRIREALARFDGNRTRAARYLGISRRALQLKLKALAIADEGEGFLSE